MILTSVRFIFKRSVGRVTDFCWGRCRHPRHQRSPHEYGSFVIDRLVFLPAFHRFVQPCGPIDASGMSTDDDEILIDGFTKNELIRMESGLPPWESMSFACGGWLQFYMYGVCKALQVNRIDKGVTYAGCSAGALAAVGIALGGDFDRGVTYCKEACIPVAHSSLQGLMNLHVYVEGCIDNCFTPVYTQEKASHIQLAATSLPYFGAGRLKDFTSAEDLKDAILASCAAYPAARAQRHRGTLYVDGGLSDFQPIVDSDTITVSPFYFSNCDIKPSRYVPLWWAFIPPNSNDTVDWLYSLGYDDCLQYLERRKVLKYVKYRPEVHEEALRLPEKNTSLDKLMDISHVTRQQQQQQQQQLSEGTASPSHHPYDKPNKVSLHRFLGYDLHTFSNYYISFALDLYLLLLLLVVWKPLALSLIYFELFLRIVCLTLLVALKISGIHYLVVRVLLNRKNDNKSRNQSILGDTLEELSDCLVCVFSLSLVLRFFSGRPTPSVELRKHDRLAKHSLLYRVFRHII